VQTLYVDVGISEGFHPPGRFADLGLGSSEKSGFDHCQVSLAVSSGLLMGLAVPWVYLLGLFCAVL
jgi:hypothetical protein